MSGVDVGGDVEEVVIASATCYRGLCAKYNTTCVLYLITSPGATQYYS
jgi:hypothetical protein